MRFLLRTAAAGIALIVLASCGGGGGNTVALTPAVTPQTAATATQTVAIASSIALPAAGGLSGTLGLAAASSFPVGTTVTSVVTNVPPLALPPLSRARRIDSVVPSQVTSYLTLVFSNTVTLAQLPSFALTIPAADVLPNTNYFLAFYDPLRPSLGWQNGFEGPAPAATSLNFSGSGAITFVAGVVYGFGLYAQSIAAPAPTPAPSIAPLAAPGALAASATSLSFGSTGTQNNQLLTITDSVATTAITESDNCSGIATLTGSALASNARTFTVSPLANGLCSATFADSNGASIGVGITVNVTNVGVQAKERN
jgi:hypothetical protein